jgi:L-alanine-DL-glutamate epimerase-like enolase superfamily enzyme
MRKRIWWYGYTGGIAAFALSAVDMALWDLKGKLPGRTLSQMLGGPLSERTAGGASPAPSGAGLGVDVMEEAVKRFAREL